MIYIDSNIFIYSVVSKSDELISSTKNMLRKIAEGQIEAATAVLTWDEFCWIVRKNLGSEFAKLEGTKFLMIPNLKLLSVDATVILEAQRLVDKYNLKPRDAIHAGCAIKHGIKEFLSDDPDFDDVKEIKRIKL